MFTVYAELELTVFVPTTTDEIVTGVDDDTENVCDCFLDGSGLDAICTE